MRSFIDIDRTFSNQPRELGAILARIDTGRGQEQSITASNAIEGVVVEGERAVRIAEGAPRLRNRSEQEFAGYRDAVDGLMGPMRPSR